MPKQTERTAKPVGTKAAGKSVPPKAAATRTRKPRPQSVSPAQRYAMIAEAAYLLAEQDGFNPTHTLDHWLAAEASIDARFGGQATH